MRLRDRLLLGRLLCWYVARSIWTAQLPADPQFWLISSIFPTAFVLIIGAHYTYAQVLVGQ